VTKYFTPYSLLLGLLVTGPGLWSAFNDPGVPVTPAVIHFVVASLVFGVGLALLGTIVGAYSGGAGRRGGADAAGTAAGSVGDAATAVADPLTDRTAATTDDRGIDADGALSAA
jgi:hypothetical protein